MATERKPREFTSRELESRIESWKPPSVLPNPEPQDGWAFRWIRSALLGRADNMNVSTRFREGWVPVQAKDHPEFEHLLPDIDSRWAGKGNIEAGGQLLCKAPQEVMEARARYYQQRSEAQMAAVDSQLLKESDARMPISQPNRRTQVSFGRGRG